MHSTMEHYFLASLFASILSIDMHYVPRFSMNPSLLTISEHASLSDLFNLKEETNCSPCINDGTCLTKTISGLV